MTDPRTTDAPVTVEPDWLNADTCIENMQVAYDDATEDEDETPVDTVVSAGDLGVLIGLAQYAVSHRLAALASAPAGDGVEATVLTITVRKDGSTSFHSSIPTDQSWEDTRVAMEVGMGEFQRQFDDSDKCPVKAAALARPHSAVALVDNQVNLAPSDRTRMQLSAIVIKHTKIGGYPDTHSIAHDAYDLGLAAALARSRAAVEPWASHVTIAREAVGALFDDDGQDALASAVRAGRQDHCTPMQAALRALRLMNPTIADSPRAAVGEREAQPTYSADQIEEMQERADHLRSEIRRCTVAIEKGTADGWWYEDRSRLQHELCGIDAILALQSPPAKVE